MMDKAIVITVRDVIMALLVYLPALLGWYTIIAVAKRVAQKSKK